MLPFEAIPPIFQVPAWLQHVVKEFIESLVEKPGRYVWVFHYVFLTFFGRNLAIEISFIVH
jgi:hypothetical protein